MYTSVRVCTTPGTVHCSMEYCTLLYGTCCALGLRASAASSSAASRCVVRTVICANALVRASSSYAVILGILVNLVSRDICDDLFSRD